MLEDLAVPGCRAPAEMDAFDDAGAGGSGAAGGQGPPASGAPAGCSTWAARPFAAASSGASDSSRDNHGVAGSPRSMSSFRATFTFHPTR